MKKIYAAACVVACCMGNPAAAYIPGCSHDGYNHEAYNLCIQMQDALRQQQWELENIQRELESSDYLHYQ